MFFFTIEKRPDRCEMCRFTNKETRFVAPPHGLTPMYTYSPNSVDVLVCKRMPPIANADGNGVSPVVHENDYCGEFQARDKRSET